MASFVYVGKTEVVNISEYQMTMFAGSKSHYLKYAEHVEHEMMASFEKGV